MNKEFKYEFKLQVQKVYLKIPFECSVQIWWRRGKGKTTTRIPVKLKGGQSYFKFAEPMIIQGKCMYTNGQFQPKESLIQIVVFNYDNTTKLGGSCVVDLTKIISPKNISMNHSQNFEVPLQNTPDKDAKIQFTLSVKFMGEAHDDSNADISFQANNPNETSNMTFRPSSRERKPSVRKSNTSQNFFKNPQSPLQLQPRQAPLLKPNQRPLQFSFNPTVKVDHDKQNKAQMQMISQLRQQVNEKNRELESRNKEIQSLKQRIFKLEEGERRQYTNTNEKSLQLMNELNIANTKVQEARQQVRQVQKQLKFIQNENDSIRGEKLNLRKQLERVSAEMTECKLKVDQSYKQSSQLKSISQQSTKRLQLVQKQRDQLKQELFKKQSQYITLENKYEKEITAMKHKSNNDLVMIDEELKQLKTKIDQLYKENLQLKKQASESNRKSLQTSRQNQQVKRALTQRTKQLQKFNSEHYRVEQQIQTLRKSMKVVIQQKQQQKLLLQQKLINSQQTTKNQQQKYAMLQQRFRQKQQLLQEIEFEFHHLQSSNQNQKDYQLTSIKDKLLMAQKRIQQLQQSHQSLNIMISEQKIKIKNLQSACDNLEKQLDERDQIIHEKDATICQKDNIIEKAKLYVKQKEKELEQRDEFISNAKNYMQQREKQFQEQKKNLQQYIQTISSTNSTSNKQTQGLKRKISQLTYQLQTLQISLNDKQNLLKDKQSQMVKNQTYLKTCSQTLNEKIQRIQDLEHYIQNMQQKIDITQEEFQQVIRKNQGLNETLQEVVRKNFQMEIQLNVKEVQLNAARITRAYEVGMNHR